MSTSIIFPNFRAELLSLDGVTDIVGQAVYFGVVPKEASLPAITLNPSGGDAAPIYGGQFDWEQLSIQVGCYSRDFTQLLELFDVISEHFNGFIGELNGVARATAARTIVNPFLSIPQDDGINGLVFDIEIQYDGA